MWFSIKKGREKGRHFLARVNLADAPSTPIAGHFGDARCAQPPKNGGLHIVTRRKRTNSINGFAEASDRSGGPAVGSSPRRSHGNPNRHIATAAMSVA